MSVLASQPESPDLKVLIVKKGIVALLVVLALVVLISPGLIGRMAEKSVDENLNWAAQETGDLVVTSESFDRGWFSSEGQHRVEIGEGNLKSVLSDFGEPGDLPVLVINTRLDHGLIPVTSMTRDKGSLAPGLGSAISKLSIEHASGETLDLPGTIYSKVALGGELESNFVLEAGTHDGNGSTASWGATDVDITTNPASGDVSFDGSIGKLTVTDAQDQFEIGGMTFSGHQEQTKYGIAIGELQLKVDGFSVAKNGVTAGGIKYLNVDGSTTLDGDQINGRTVFDMESLALPGFGEVKVKADISVANADAEALGALQQAVDAQGSSPDPTQMFASIEGDLKKLLASGLEVRFDQFDVTVPQGTVEAKIEIMVSEEDIDTFEWTSLLLGTEASADIRVPEALVDMAMQMNPQAGAVVGMGFLKKNGDVYEMVAEYKKGLLTINGAPMPIPLGAM